MGHIVVRSLPAGRVAEPGESLARSGLDYAYMSDFPWMHAYAHSDLGNVLAAQGRRDEARAELERAIQRFESFGNVAEADRTRKLLVEL